MEKDQNIVWQIWYNIVFISSTDTSIEVLQTRISEWMGMSF